MRTARQGGGRKGSKAPRGTRYLTFYCHRRQELLCTASIRDAFADQLESVHARRAFKLFAWAVLPDHAHLLLTPAAPNWSVSKVVQAIKQPFAQKIIQRWRDADEPLLAELEDGSGLHHFWDHGREQEQRLTGDRELRRAIADIHAAPVKRGLVSQPHHWLWSSAGWYEGRRDSPVTIDAIG